MDPEIATVTLWRPVGPKELDLIRQSGMRAFPPRLPGQPIFYPVLSKAYAAKIARDWNVPASGKGYVTRFLVAEKFLDRYQVREAGGKIIWSTGFLPKTLERSTMPSLARSKSCRVRLMRRTSKN